MRLISPGPVGSQALLPDELMLLEELDITEAEYRQFLREAQSAKDIKPDDTTMFWWFVLAIVVGAALNYLAAVLFPPAQQAKPAALESRTIDGQNLVNGSRFAPTSGFDTGQNVVELLSIVPVVFTKRETIGGVTYGGIRVNTNLLWSQLYSLGGGQLFKALLLVGVAGIAKPKASQIAVGSNLLASYDLDPAGNTAGRATIYAQNVGRRIKGSDFLAGRHAHLDIGNSETAGAADMLQIRGVNGQWISGFCHAYSPGSQSTFGLYAPIGNGLGYKINPKMRSISVAKLKATGDKGDAIVKCEDDPQSRAERQREKWPFAGRGGFIQVDSTPITGYLDLEVVKDQIVYYHMSHEADDRYTFKRTVDGPDGEAECLEIAQTIAGRQKTWADAMLVGGLFKCGQALLTLISKSPDAGAFSSRVDSNPAGGGQSMTYGFRVTQGGWMSFAGNDVINKPAVNDSTNVFRNGTQQAHLYRVAIATFTLPRAAQVIEIGFTTNCSITYQGLTNFSAALDYKTCDGRSCEDYEGDRISKGDTLTTTNIQSPTIQNGQETRYVFHRISYRLAGDVTWIPISELLFGFKGIGGKESRDYLRLQLPTNGIYEIQHMPVDGWEIRHGYAGGYLCILDASLPTLRTVYGAGCIAEFNGTFLGRDTGSFGLPATESDITDAPQAKDGRSFVDAWGKIANIFEYNEISLSNSSPECRISYVNIFEANETEPTYAGCSTMAITIRSDPEFQQLSQVSTFIESGFGDTHLIGSVLRIMATNRSFGLGRRISPKHITSSFDDADAWTYNRRYFFDGVFGEPFNFRQKGAQLAEYFLLDLLCKGMEFYLQPIAEEGVIYSPVAMYTSGNTSSLEASAYEPAQRTPSIFRVSWRQERQSPVIGNQGMFPVIREVTIREASTPADAPVVVIDETKDFVTSEIHAIDIGKMAARKSRLITWGAKLVTRPDRASFEPGRVVKLGMRVITYNTTRNGIILADGTVVMVGTSVADSPLADGTYPMLLWNGNGSTPLRLDVTVTAGKASHGGGYVFTIGEGVPTSQMFKVQKVDFTDAGDVEAEVTEFPLDADGRSLLVEGWNVPGNWVIEGRIKPDQTVPVDPTFRAVRILGLATQSVGASSTYSAVVSGPAGAYSYAWNVSNGQAVIAAPLAATTDITFPAGGNPIISLAVTLNGVTQIDTQEVQVGVVTAKPTIGAVTVSGPGTGTAATALTFQAAHAGTATDVSWVWSVSAGDPVVVATGATASITFEPGTYRVRARAVSATSSDSPQSGELEVVITV